MSAGKSAYLASEGGMGIRISLGGRVAGQSYNPGFQDILSTAEVDLAVDSLQPAQLGD